MRVERRQKSLHNVPLFMGLSEDELQEIERTCSWRTYAEGEEIVGYEADSDEIYFVIAGTGRVKIYSATGKVVAFRELGPGDVFGEYAALDQQARTASIEAEDDCVVAIMRSEDFRRAAFENPIVSRALVLHLVAQLRILTRRVFEFSTLAVNNRIQAELLRLAREELNATANKSNTARLPRAPTHAEIAARISTHREAVSRHLGDLARMGLVERDGRALVIKDVECLDRMVREATGE